MPISRWMEKQNGLSTRLGRPSLLSREGTTRWVCKTWPGKEARHKEEHTVGSRRCEILGLTKLGRPDPPPSAGHWLWGRGRGRTTGKHSRTLSGVVAALPYAALKTHPAVSCKWLHFSACKGISTVGLKSKHWFHCCHFILLTYWQCGCFWNFLSEMD